MNSTLRCRLPLLFSALFAVLVFTGFSCSYASTSPDTTPLQELVPTRTLSKTSVEIAKQLKYNHYRKLIINDELSSRVFDRFLSDLDNQRIYFLSEDIHEFETYRYRLDEALKKGDLKPGFEIFNRYLQRAVERLTFLTKCIDDGLESIDFNVDEDIMTDREKAPWPQNQTELGNLWRKRLKDTVLNLKLDGKTIQEIQELLGKRYRNQLNRLHQTHTMDAFQAYMNALTQIYDPHTQYFAPRISENFDIMMSLSLEGIGAVLHMKDEYIEVLRLVPAGPAEKSKALKPGDRIIGVAQGKNGEMTDVIGWRLDDVVDLIRGPKKTVVRLAIIPADSGSSHQKKNIMITRDTVKLEEQSAQKKIIDLEHNYQQYKIGIIDIPTFYIDFKAFQAGDPDYKSTTRDVRRLLKELMAARVNGIVIDLRDNGGGALQEASELTGLFIKQGPTVQVRSNTGKISVIQDPDPDIVYDGPLVVLTNRLSASASEIFAGAIQDYHRGIIVGTQTFGKGTVQSLQPLRKGQLKLTRAKFYRASGKSTQNQGVIPDILFPAIYNARDIGESALPEALPWDRVQSAPYHTWPELLPVINHLKSLHDQRVRNEPEFEYMTARLERQKELDQKTIFSLNESIRRQERKALDDNRLDLENSRRISKGLKPFKSIADLKASREADEKADDPKSTGVKEDEEDPLLTESQKILADYIYFNHRNIARQ